MTLIPERFTGKLERLAPTTRKALDGLNAVEFLARLMYVEHLDKAAAAPGLDPVTCRGYAELAAKVLAAKPREEVEQRVTTLHKTALAVSHDAGLRASTWGTVAKLRRDNPPVPEEFVAAARARIAEEAAAERAASIRKAAAAAAAAAAARRVTPRKITPTRQATLAPRRSPATGKAPAGGPTMLYKASGK